MDWFRWRRAPTDPQERADRWRLAKRHRVVAGLHLDPHCSSLAIAVLQGVGQGKYLSVRPLYAESFPVRKELGAALRRLISEPDPPATLMAECGQDLASQQAPLLRQARAACGKLGEQLVAAAVGDPGFWRLEFDGQRSYLPLSHPETLAEQTGVCVIDALPAKDVAAGGHGRPLTPLASWIALADRTAPVADQTRLLLHVADDISATLLPPSDGLDELYPAIQFRRWEAELEGTAAERMQRANEIARDLAQWLNASVGASSLEFILAVESNRDMSLWTSSLLQTFPQASCRILEEFGFDPRSVQAAWVALLGILFIDQLPASLPWLTGAEMPRILGRVTPGSPVAWRQLLREMADHHPPAMRLREAV